MERSSKAHLKQSLATASPKISRRRGRDSLANLQFGEAKEIVHEDDEFSLNQPKKANFNGNSSHEAGSDGLEKPSGERKLTQRKNTCIVYPLCKLWRVSIYLEVQPR